MGFSENRGRRSVAGYTMLELLVVISITAILAAISVPGMQDSLRRNAKDSGLLDFMSAISLARSEAVAQSRLVTICRSTDMAACAVSSGADWSAGWIVFTDASTAGTVDAGDTILKTGQATNNLSVVSLKNLANANFTKDFLQFDRDGSLKSSATGAYFKFCDASNTAINARAILLSNTGRSIPSTADASGNHKNLAGANLACP